MQAMTCQQRNTGLSIFTYQYHISVTSSGMQAATAADIRLCLQVKMVTADDDSTTDIVVEGDTEEVTRMSKELQLVEKGKVYVKGILEN